MRSLAVHHINGAAAVHHINGAIKIVVSFVQYISGQASCQISLVYIPWLTILIYLDVIFVAPLLGACLLAHTQLVRKAFLFSQNIMFTYYTMPIVLLVIMFAFRLWDFTKLFYLIDRVNFKKNEKTYDAEKSAVFKVLQEEENDPEPGISLECSIAQTFPLTNGRSLISLSYTKPIT